MNTRTTKHIEVDAETHRKAKAMASERAETLGEFMRRVMQALWARGEAKRLGD